MPLSHQELLGTLAVPSHCPDASPLGLGAGRSGLLVRLGWTGVGPSHMLSLASRRALTSSLYQKRGGFPDPSGAASMPQCFARWATWLRAPLTRKYQSPWLPTPTLPLQQPRMGNCCGSGSSPDTASHLSHAGHQLYLPQPGNAQASWPSTRCSLDVSGASPVWAPLFHVLSSHTGNWPRWIAALWERLDAALPASQLTHTGTPIPRSAYFSPHTGRGEPKPSVSFEIRRECVFRSMTPRLASWAQFSLSRLKSRHFCFNFIFFKKTKTCTNLPDFIGRFFLFLFYIFWCPFVLDHLLHL